MGISDDFEIKREEAWFLPGQRDKKCSVCSPTGPGLRVSEFCECPCHQNYIPCEFKDSFRSTPDPDREHKPWEIAYGAYRMQSEIKMDKFGHADVLQVARQFFKAGWDGRKSKELEVAYSPRICAHPGCEHFRLEAGSCCCAACVSDYQDWMKVRACKIKPMDHVPIDNGYWDRTVPEGIGFTEHKVSLHEKIMETVRNFRNLHMDDPHWILAFSHIPSHMLQCLSWLHRDYSQEQVPPDQHIEGIGLYQDIGGYRTTDEPGGFYIPVFHTSLYPNQNNQIWVGGKQGAISFEITT